MSASNKILLILIGTIVTLLTVQRSCTPTSPSDDVIITTKTETRFDTIHDSITAYVPKWKTKIITDTDTLLLNVPVDTQAILKDYFSTYLYVDTIQRDSLFMILTDNISQNTIKSRKVEYKLIIPTITITNDIITLKNKFYIGGGVLGNKQGINYIGGEFTFINKKDQLYGLNLGINGELKPVIGFKTGWKIGK